MEIVVIDVYNGEKFIIPLSEAIDNTGEICGNLCFCEDRTYRISIDLSKIEEVETVNVFVDDICLKTSFNEDTYKVDGLAERIFEDCFDVTKLRVEILFADESVQVLETANLSVAIRKTTSAYIEKMLYDIENNYSGILSTCFAKCRKNSGLGETSRTESETLDILRNIYTTMKEMYPMFQRNANKKIKEEQDVQDAINAGLVNDETVEWIVKHPEYIKKSLSITPLKVGQNYYKLDRVTTLNKNVHQGTYENQVILGFLQSVLDYLNEVITDIKKLINRYNSKIPEDIIRCLPNDYELAYNCVSFYYREFLRRLEEFQQSYGELYEAYNFCLGCEPINVTAVPRYTFAFRQRYHYRRVFDSIVLWYEKGGYDLQAFAYFMKMKRMSSIFEYYTLLKLCDAFVKNDFKLMDEPKILDYDESVNDLNNYYIYKNRNKTTVEIFYEPYIFDNKIEYGLNLYCTGYNFSKIMKSHCIEETKYWRPDFVVKVTTYENEFYFVLDSKFSKFRTVKNYHIVSLANKYLMNIATRNQFHSKVLGVWAVYPAIKEERMNMKKNNINSTKKSLPIVAIEPLLTSQNTLEKWVSLIQQLCAEYIEEYSKSEDTFYS